VNSVCISLGKAVCELCLYPFVNNVARCQQEKFFLFLFCFVAVWSVLSLYYENRWVQQLGFDSVFSHKLGKQVLAANLGK
jgi:hypothetical protein